MSSIAFRALPFCAEDPWFETQFELKAERSLTVHQAANGDLVENNGEIKAMRKGTSHPTSQCRWPMISVLSNRHFPDIRSYLLPFISQFFEVDYMVIKKF